MNRKFCYLMLTCEPGEEQKIATALLEKRLIACAKFVPINSSFWWHGEIENGAETTLVMESSEELFDEIEAEITKIHSYDTFVLTCIPMSKINKDAAKWLQENLKELA